MQEVGESSWHITKALDILLPVINFRAMKRCLVRDTWGRNSDNCMSNKSIDAGTIFAFITLLLCDFRQSI